MVSTRRMKCNGGQCPAKLAQDQETAFTLLLAIQSRRLGDRAHSSETLCVVVDRGSLLEH